MEALIAIVIEIVISVLGGLFNIMSKPPKAEVVHSDKEEKEWADMANDAWQEL